MTDLSPTDEGPFDPTDLPPLGTLSHTQYRPLARTISKRPPPLPRLNLLMLSSYTTEFLDPFLLVESVRTGFMLQVRHGGFGQFEQALLAPQTDGNTEDHDALVLIMRPEDLDPDAIARYHATGGTHFGALVDQMIDRVSRCAELFREHSTGPVLIANLATPASPPLGPFDASNPGTVTHAIADANHRLAKAAAAQPGVYIWDFAGLVATRGSENWVDPRWWVLARAPIAPIHQPSVAAHCCRVLRAIMQPAAKCLVLDLDNTLWGGAVGDDGVEGIEVGDDHPGLAFKEFQRAILGLRDRGIMIAVASKNNPDVVDTVFREHREMLIRDEHLAARRVNWDPKSGNLRAIADELNIGLDSLVFFDDNPVEREEVRINAPGVVVVDVPADPALYVDALAALSCFDSPSITVEDLGRADQYQAQRERRTAEREAGSIDEFLVTLEMEAEVGRFDDLSAARIAQLVQKTNQFNLTTRRHGPTALAEFARGDGGVHWLRLRDRYGDQGLICLGILVMEGGQRAVVESLVMSCRVANRYVEEAMLAHLAEHARAAGARYLVGEYVATGRNQVVSNLYARLGFDPAESTEDGCERFELDLDKITLDWPNVLRRP